MSFSEKLKSILKNKKPKKYTLTCKNFWCKAHYEVFDDDYQDNRDKFSQCPKCRSFDSNLSGGVTNNGQIEYEGDRFDPNPQEIDYKQYMGDQMFNKNNFNKKW